ncbi:uncharacterized protein TRIADDRAFT_50444 [Trichoplax adhaerens]|uniref:Cytochrome P450 n=1 Tax=Trichoplax adhaerens TaxID=10228 RepID=B3S1D7_TRIAD|nr:hypothetical protein TRIADDRAFT_50444 [Trichoplax adhaerens]EDV23309.1 hypothetical protein TRIADDRAFT_50444 [Trichoplax adhaerens]|eukprot:XP_002114219.1 hypothetical protein TRIADDRAFT_50444 [Trichoplax adhaerens]
MHFQLPHRCLSVFCLQLNQFPSPQGHWLYGSLSEMQNPDNILSYLQKQCQNYPSSFFLRLGPFMSILVCNSPDAAKAVIASGGAKENYSYTFIREWLGDGLLISNGGKWARNRKLVTPAFHFGVLKHYLPIYNRCVDVVIEKWSSQAATGQSFEIYSDMNFLTLDIILQSSFSLKTQCQTIGKNDPYVTVVKELAWLTVNRFFSLTGYIPFLYYLTSEGRRFNTCVKESHRFTENVIRKRLREVELGSESNVRDYIDFLDILIKARDRDGKGLSFNNIRNEVETFMFAGHDTTSSALSFTIYLLSKHKEHQQKVRDEVKSVLQGRSDIAWNDLSELKYTTICIKEAMRLYTTVPMIERVLDKDVKIDGITVLAGTKINIPIFVLHGKANTWLNRDEYNPSRFLSEEIAQRDAFSYIPFSAGSRNCIGQSFAMNVLKVAVAKIVRHYHLEIDETKPVVTTIPLVMKSATGIWIKVNEL